MLKVTWGSLVVTRNSFYSHLWPHKTYSKYWLMPSSYTPAQRDESSVQALGLTTTNPRTELWHHMGWAPRLTGKETDCELSTSAVSQLPDDGVTSCSPCNCHVFPNMTLKLRPQINPFFSLKLLLWGMVSVRNVTDRTSPESGSVPLFWFFLSLLESVCSTEAVHRHPF